MISEVVTLSIYIPCCRPSNWNVCLLWTLYASIKEVINGHPRWSLVWPTRNHFVFPPWTWRPQAQDHHHRADDAVLLSRRHVSINLQEPAVLNGCGSAISESMGLAMSRSLFKVWMNRTKVVEIMNPSQTGPFTLVFPWFSLCPGCIYLVIPE